MVKLKKKSVASSRARKSARVVPGEARDNETERSANVSSGSAAHNKRSRTLNGDNSIASSPQKIRKLQIVDEEPLLNEAGRSVTQAGDVLVVGQGDVGQLGLGEDIMERSRPAHVTALPSDIMIIEAGGMHTVCVSGTGKVYTFGCNDEGALGRDTSREGSEFEPGLVAVPGKVVQVSAGDSHTAVLTSDGRVFAWGTFRVCGDSHTAVLTSDGRVFAWGTFRDSSGMIGLGSSMNQQKTPLQLIPEEHIMKISSGSDHLVCLTKDGDIFTCGCAEQGQLGRIAERFSKRGGRRGFDLILQPRKVYCKRVKGKAMKFDNIWTGSYVTFARVQGTGQIYTFGLNNFTQLGVPREISPVFMPLEAKSFAGNTWVKIKSGQHHTLALDSNGKVYSLGRREYGRLGLGQGDLADRDEPSLIPGLTDHRCKDVSCGTCVSYAVSVEGAVYAWGMGTNCQLGTGDDEDCWEPVRMGGKQLSTRSALSVSGGGQHAVILASQNEADSNKGLQNGATS